jgi:hypothetical protein
MKLPPHYSDGLDQGYVAEQRKTISFSLYEFIHSNVNNIHT